MRSEAKFLFFFYSGRKANTHNHPLTSDFYRQLLPDTTLLRAIAVGEQIPHTAHGANRQRQAGGGFYPRA